MYPSLLVVGNFIITNIIIILIRNCMLSSSSLCQHVSCENGPRLDYPFWPITADRYTSYCGYPGFGITCDRQGMPRLRISNNDYYVRNLNSQSRQLEVVGIDIEGVECPRPLNFTQNPFGYYPFKTTRNGKRIYLFYNCSHYPPDLVHITCLEYNATKRSYAYLSSEYTPPTFNWSQNCEDLVLSPTAFDGPPSGFLTPSDYALTLQAGLSFYWDPPTGSCSHCEDTGGKCRGYDDTTSHGCVCGTQEDDVNWGACGGSTTQLKIIIGVSAGVAGLLLILIFVARRRLCLLYTFVYSCMKGIKNQRKVDLFLKNYGDLVLQRYMYPDIKRMTNSFAEKLGQGGYGSVFKGKLLNGRLVAVKVLKEAKGDGEDFINEVSTIGRTNHINVVRLLGFCSDRGKRALVYEFMTNGSLERFIHMGKQSDTTNPLLGWERLYRIALGIAKGLEYLHSGCNTRILHFDIKPHNILLDQDFCPKISDFGLAKLCDTRDSIVSMLGARGTLGYIAPEICCRNLGSVSYKSDVYSYGMMVLEMIGGRKNIDITVENTSEIYFPHWIYTHLENDGSITGSEEFYKEETTKKMVFVGLWCIQTTPISRPSMSKVVEMLEGNMGDLEMPPNPMIGSAPAPSLNPTSPPW